ncbi:IS3 family transposase [Streptomyces sp. WG7]|uniref:IS3 family transposase n=1 Tax=Streptomyces sp. WG7 TaxID=3417650 RepID=UPI003CEA48F8
MRTTRRWNLSGLRPTTNAFERHSPPRARRRTEEENPEGLHVQLLGLQARTIWRELNRQGHQIARRTMERLMRELRIQSASRSKRVIITVPGSQVGRAPTFWAGTCPAATVKEMVSALDALEMASWQRDRDQQSIQPGELIHHSDGRVAVRVSGSPNTWTWSASPPRSARPATPTP